MGHRRLAHERENEGDDEETANNYRRVFLIVSSAGQKKISLADQHSVKASPDSFSLVDISPLCRTVVGANCLINKWSFRVTEDGGSVERLELFPSKHRLVPGGRALKSILLRTRADQSSVSQMSGSSWPRFGRTTVATPEAVR